MDTSDDSDEPSNTPPYGLAIPAPFQNPLEPLEQFCKIKASYKDYHLCFPDTIDSVDWAGHTNRYKNICQVQHSLDTREKAGTLVHELGHIAFDLAGLTTTYDTGMEESIINPLFAAFAGLIRDNPELFIRLVEDLKGG